MNTPYEEKKNGLYEKVNGTRQEVKSFAEQNTTPPLQLQSLTETAPETPYAIATKPRNGGGFGTTKEFVVGREKVADSFPTGAPQSIDTGKELAVGLVQLLANTTILKCKTQEVHWNVEGPLFDAVHRMTEEQYSEQEKAIDEIGERIRAMGFFTPANFDKYQKLSTLHFEEEGLSAEEMLRVMMRDNETLCSCLRGLIKVAKEHDDEVTTDMLITRLAAHEKYVWMWRSMLGVRSQKL